MLFTTKLLCSMYFPSLIMSRHRFIPILYVIVLCILNTHFIDAVPFGDIHRNIFPLSVARFTRSVLYGRDATPSPSTSLMPTVPLKDVQELSNPNPEVDTIAALAPMDSQPFAQQPVPAQESQAPVADFSIESPSRSTPPTPGLAFDNSANAKYPNSGTEEFQRSVVVTTDYSNGKPVFHPSVVTVKAAPLFRDERLFSSDSTTAESYSESQVHPLNQNNRSAQANPAFQKVQGAANEMQDVIQSTKSHEVPKQYTSFASETIPKTEIKSEHASDVLDPQTGTPPNVDQLPSSRPDSLSKRAEIFTAGVTNNTIVAKGSSNADEKVRRSDISSVMIFPLERRVYSTNLLPGCRKDNPSLLPPGFGGSDAANKTILDVGAHIGDDYTIRGVTVGHTVIAFEPSPAVVENFKKFMIEKGMPLSVVNLDHAVAAAAHARSRLARNTIDGMVVRVLIPRTASKAGKAGDPSSHGGGVDMSQARVFLMPFALSNVTGLTKFFESRCKLSNCGKVNRIPMQEGDSVPGNIIVPKYKLDDLILPTDTRKIWFLKVDVEGHELEVLQGARDLIRRSGLEYIVLEFSPNGQSGVQWGIKLLEELFEQGFTCFHLRGFGKCHDDSVRSPSLKCNFPFALNNASSAPTFLQYTKVFEIDRNDEKRPHMADLMCKRRQVASQNFSE